MTTVDPHVPTGQEGDEARTGRMAWADNLRVAVIAGVIITHVATAYILDIDWYYEARSASPITEALVAAVILPGALFAMGALFFVAGLMAALSLARKGVRRFAVERLSRLGVPLVAFMFVIGPLTSLIGQRAQHAPATRPAFSFLREEARHADTGPMWFVAALLVFTTLYAVLRYIGPPRHRSTPINRALVRGGVAIVIGSYLIRVAWPFAEDTPLSLNLWEWPQMAVLFAPGVVAQEQNWAQPLPRSVIRRRRRVGAAALCALPILGAVIAASDKEAFLGGWHAQALAFPTLEAATSIGIALWAVDWFSRHGAQDGQVARSLARASFGAYFLHATVVVGLSAAVATAPAAAELKFVTVATLGVFTSYGLGALGTRTPLVRRFL